MRQLTNQSVNVIRRGFVCADGRAVRGIEHADGQHSNVPMAPAGRPDPVPMVPAGGGRRDPLAPSARSAAGAGAEAGAAAGAGAGAAAGAGGWTRRQVLALVVLCLAALLDTIDVTVVNVAMPAIKASLGFSEGGLAWMVNAYMVPFGGFLLLGGRAGDLFGRRRVLLSGTLVFTAASLASALARNSAMMIVTRAAEGLAAAFVVPMTLAILGDVFPKGPARNRAFAVWGGVSAAAGTLGLILGGLLVSAVGWRWIFFINLPVGALVMIAAARVLPADGTQAADSAQPGRRQPFDLIGAVAATGGASLLAYAIAQAASHPWGSARTISLLAGAAALLVAFVLRERATPNPLLPLSLLRNNSVSGANLTSALLSSAVFAMFYATTLYMQLVLRYSALRTGLYYIPLGVSILTAAGLAPQLVRALGVRLTTGAGAALSTAGLLLFARIPVDANPVTGIVVPSVITGLGGGLVLVATSIAGLTGVPATHRGVASALLNASRQLGGALGLAAISTVMASSAAGFKGSAQAALTHGFRAGFTVGAGLLIGAVVAAMLLLREDGRGERINPLELQAG